MLKNKNLRLKLGNKQQKAEYWMDAFNSVDTKLQTSELCESTQSLKPQGTWRNTNQAAKSMMFKMTDEM